VCVQGALGSRADGYVGVCAQDVAKRTERLAGGPVTGSKGFTDVMSRVPDADYPVLGGKVPQPSTLRSKP